MTLSSKVDIDLDINSEMSKARIQNFILSWFDRSAHKNNDQNKHLTQNKICFKYEIPIDKLHSLIFLN